MPIILFILLYITGVMLSFAEKSNIRGFSLNVFFRVLMFLKVKKRQIFFHTLIFQGINLTMFGILLILYFLMNEKDSATVYNIYRWVSLGLFTVIIVVTAADTIILEKNGKGKIDESN